ncbi:MAG: A/G-specific adenine glycosylase [Oscillibacter sp.]|nr:A/G-specific adenine glycosylase [Oscillibacter sp.]
MRSLAFHSNHFTAGTVLLDYDGADIAESYHLAFVGGTEENVKGGVLFRREADTLPHASQISLGDCKTFPLAFLLLQVTTEVEGIRLTRPISVEIHTESVLPRALPTVADLAAVEEDRLMKLWQGLGYYNRARNLQKAARQVAEDFGGVFPDTYEGLLTLSGVGEYTAGAIASIAFGVPVPAVDGNVLRVVARISGDGGDIARPDTKARMRAALQAVLPVDAPGDFNQALMELGATVCAPNGPPRCLECPAMAFCKGRLRGTAEDLPVKGAKKPRRVEEKTVFLLVRDGKIALRKRPGTGLLAGLWEFPNVEGALDEAAAGAAVSVWGLEPRRWESRLTAKHIFTHVEWHMTGYTLEVAGDGPADFVWADAGALSDRAVPSAFGRYYTEAAARLKEE